MKVKSESEVAQSYPTLRDRMDCSLPGSSVHGISQARVLEWGAIAFSVIRYMTCKYFLQFCLLSFQVFCRYFWISNIFDFDKVQFMFYSFIDCTSRVIAKNPLPNPRSWDLLLCFLNNVTGLALRFRYRPIMSWLPRRLSGKDSWCQYSRCRRWEFDP